MMDKSCLRFVLWRCQYLRTHSVDGTVDGKWFKREELARMRSWPQMPSRCLQGTTEKNQEKRQTEQPLSWSKFQPGTSHSK